MTTVGIRATGVRETSRALRAAPGTVNAEIGVLTARFGVLLQTRVRARASGRPGPRRQTGDYRRGISVQTVQVAPGVWTSTVGTNSPQGRRLEYGFTGRDSLGRVYCVDAATEVLTEDGWRTHDQLAAGDVVMTLNPDTWLMEWQPATAVNRFPGEHQVLRVDARTVSTVATLDHRWLIERYYARKRTWLREWRTTATMPTNGRIPLVQKCANLPQVATIDDDVVELAAWFWTEGCYEWSMQHGPSGERERTGRPIGLSLAQSGVVYPENHERIVRMLTRLLGEPGPFATGAHWHGRVNQASGVTHFRLDRVACWLLERHVTPPHKVPAAAFLRALTQEQLDLFIEVSLLADGSTDRNGVTRLGQAHEGRIRAFEMACVLGGRPVVTRHGIHHGFEHWDTTLLRSSASYAFDSALRVDRDHAQAEAGVVDFVWCPTTPNGTWLARRDGRIYFTGNSQPPYPHFGPALDETVPEYETALAAAVSRVLKLDSADRVLNVSGSSA